MTLSSAQSTSADVILLRPDGANLTSVAPQSIIVRDRLRRALPDKVDAMRHMIEDQGQLQPVDLVDTPEGLRLIDGGYRVAALIALGRNVDALVHPRGTFGSEHAIRIREISQNFVRIELSALDRAVYIAEWRAAHEAIHAPAKRGRKPKPADDQEISANFALNFTNVVQEVLGLSRRSIFLALKVASIVPDVRDAIAALRLADNQSELLALAAEPHGRQQAIAALLVEGMASVAEAIATIDQTAAPVIRAGWEQLSDKFSRLGAKDQHAFFSLHEEAIMAWLAESGR